MARRGAGSAGSVKRRGVFQTAMGAVAIELEIAQTPEAVKAGLMHREVLPPGTGMLFVLREPRKRGPHMRDVRFPLSVAFMADDGTIIEILDMELCSGPPCPTYDPRLPFTRALEVNRGEFDRLGVREGDRLELD